MSDDRILAIFDDVVDVELHDEIVEWMSSLDDADWNRTVVTIDRLSGLGSTARMPSSRALGSTRRSTDMANYSRWKDIKARRPGLADEERSAIEQGFALGELIYELRTSAGLSQRELAERMGTTQSVISRLEEGGGGRPRLGTLARVATALDGTWSCPSLTRSPRASRTPSRSPEKRAIRSRCERR